MHLGLPMVVLPIEPPLWSADTLSVRWTAVPGSRLARRSGGGSYSLGHVRT